MQDIQFVFKYPRIKKKKKNSCARYSGIVAFDRKNITLKKKLFFSCLFLHFSLKINMKLFFNFLTNCRYRDS